MGWAGFGRRALALGLLVAAFSLAAAPKGALAAPVQVALPRISIGVDQATRPGDVAQSLQILFLLTVLSLAPSILILTTSFTRIVIVLSFVRSALATQQMPPNQVLVGLSLFLTLFVMFPTWQAVNANAVQPYLAGKLPADQALVKGLAPVREFMLRQTREKDLALFVEMSKTPRPRNPQDVPTQVVIPAFVISELKTAFQIGFMIFIPFLVIDMIVASTLMSMGMLMLPPVMVSLPFKILLFVLVDGWYLVVRSLLLSFR
ncbi:MAG: flagellar type III secretion system pore protein FliP [Chitinophagales bacterium]